MVEEQQFPQLQTLKNYEYFKLLDVVEEQQFPQLQTLKNYEYWSGKPMKSEWMYSSSQRRLVTLENVFDREMNCGCIHHFREDWLVTLENVFDREMKSIHHFREDWLLCRTFSIGKWRVFIISEKIGYSGERFRLGNEECSSFQWRLVTLENVFDREMKSECIHHFREDLLLWRTFSIGKWRVFIISEKIGFVTLERFSIVTWVNVFIISAKIGYSGERFRSGNELWMYSSFQRRLVGNSGERFRSRNEEYSSFQRRLVTL